MIRGRSFLTHTLLVVVVVILQSTLLSRFPLFGVVPNLAFVILVFSSIGQGTLKAEVTGFAAGLTQDMLSLSPLGFNAINRTIISSLAGTIKGKVFIDPVLMPMVIILSSSIFKGILNWFFGSIFLDFTFSQVFSRNFLLETLYSMILAIPVFWAMKTLGFNPVHDKDGFA